MDRRSTPEPEALQEQIICPYCGSGKTELFSLFGQQLLTAQYYCQACHTPFEWIKDTAILQQHYAPGNLSKAGERKSYHDDDDRAYPD